MIKNRGLFGVLLAGATMLVASCGGSGGGGASGGQILVRMSSLYGEGQILGAGPDEQVGVSFPNIHSDGSPTIWHGNTASPVKLNPSGFYFMSLLASDDTTKVGRATVSQTVGDPVAWHAVKVSGSSQTVVDLHPSGFYSSQANAVNGSNIAGYGSLAAFGQEHPLLWKGAAPMVDLIPEGVYSARVNAIFGDLQAGSETLLHNAQPHAAEWHGTAASFVDLNPAGFLSSEVFGASAKDLVGRGEPSDAIVVPGQFAPTHALRWVGSSVVDLQPAGVFASSAMATNGTIQVGNFLPTSGGLQLGRACLWRGTAASFVDLHALLPPGYEYSRALGISGKTISGWASDPDYSHIVPVMWVLP